jgi:hypothetical protein
MEESNDYEFGGESFRIVSIDNIADTDQSTKADTEPPTEITQDDTTSLFIKNFTDSSKIVEESDQIAQQTTEKEEKYSISSYTNIAPPTEFEKKVRSETEKILSDCKKLDAELPVSLIVDLERNLSNSIEELDYIISYLLVIIRSVIDANTVAFI